VWLPREILGCETETGWILTGLRGWISQVTSVNPVLTQLSELLASVGLVLNRELGSHG
jgi:hypothetical protein